MLSLCSWTQNAHCSVENAYYEAKKFADLYEVSIGNIMLTWSMISKTEVLLYHTGKCDDVKYQNTCLMHRYKWLVMHM